ncbi:MAG: pilus assembly protein TadG-related protein [Ornithinimicrobium sp.]
MPEAMGEGDEGGISILVIGMMSIALLLIVGVIAATSIQLSRIQLLDAADAAALDAADSVAEESVYGGGVDDGVPLTSEGVAAAAVEHLGARQRPSRITSWVIASGTGTPDGRTAVVRVQGQAAIPVISRAIEVFGGSVTITVESSARSDLDWSRPRHSTLDPRGDA